MSMNEYMDEYHFLGNLMLNSPKKIVYKKLKWMSMDEYG